MAKATFRGYNRVKFQSLKIGKTILCQSLILRDYLIHLEWDEDVQFYELKPFKVSVKTAVQRKVIQPHILVNYSVRPPSVVWLKSSETDHTEQLPLIKLVTNFCESKGFNFEIKYSNEIRKEPFLSNLKFLRRYLRSNITVRDFSLCREFFVKYSAPDLGSLLNYFKQKEENIETVFALLSQKIIEADVDSKPINFDSAISLKNSTPNFQNGRLAA